MKILISVDDTDDVTKETSTGEIAELIGRRLSKEGAVIIEGISRHQLLLSDEIQYTSHNSSMCFELRIDSLSKEELINICKDTIINNMAPGSDPGLAIAFENELKDPQNLIRFGFDAKKKVLTKEEAFTLAGSTEGIYLCELGGTGLGVIGALAGLGLRLSKSDGSMRGKFAGRLAGTSVTAEELAKKCGVNEIITPDGKILDKGELIYVEDFAKPFYFDGRLCCMAKRNSSGGYTVVGKHQEREKMIIAEGDPVCSAFVPDNDEEEFYHANGSRSCFNCLFRRWRGEGFSCMNPDKESVAIPKEAKYLDSQKGENAKKRLIRDEKKMQSKGRAISEGPTFDVTIIGGGIIGAMTAWKLSRYKLSILVIDKAYDIGEGETKANAGVLYPGIHARGGSLKGIACARGCMMYDEICADLDIPLKRTGSLYTAFSEEGIEKMMSKYDRGIQNGVRDMRVISGDEARTIEPGLSDKVLKAVYNPTTGIISPFALITALSEAAAVNGVEFSFSTSAENISVKNDGTYVIATNNKPIRSRYIINAAGDGAALIESFVREQDLVIKPKRGQFYIFDKMEKPYLNHVIYQAADNDEGGTLIAPTVDGNVIAGPTSDDVSDFDITDTTVEGLEHIKRVAGKILPGIDMGKLIANFAGTRANISNIEKEQKDFVVRVSAPKIISLLGIKNPGMTAAPYLTDLVLDGLRKEGLKLIEKEDFVKTFKRRKLFCELPENEQRKLWKQDHRYGRIICRCENITEGDIIEVMHSPLPPKSINGMKKRLRAGMGRCQGAFCTVRLIEIMAREMGLSPDEILKSTEGSNFVKGYLK